MILHFLWHMHLCGWLDQLCKSCQPPVAIFCSVGLLHFCKFLLFLGTFNMSAMESPKWFSFKMHNPTFWHDCMGKPLKSPWLQIWRFFFLTPLRTMKSCLHLSPILLRLNFWIMLNSCRATASSLHSAICWVASKFDIVPNVTQVACCKFSLGADSSCKMAVNGDLIPLPQPLLLTSLFLKLCVGSNKKKSRTLIVFCVLLGGVKI